MRRVLLPIVFLLTVFISCEQDNYEKGEGRYSLMRGDFAELRIDADLRATTIVTDDLERLSLKEPYTAKWIAAEGAVLCGKVDAIILTGGIAFSKYVVSGITDRVAFLAPVVVYPGQDEMLALAQNAERALGE